MTFSVKHREGDESQTPIEVGESQKTCGWNRPKHGAKTSGSGRGNSSAMFKYLLAGGLLVVLGVAAVLWFSTSPTPEKPEAEKSRTKIAGIEPSNVVREKPQIKKERVKPKSVEDAMANLEEPVKPMIKMRQLSPEEWDRLTNRTFTTGTEQLMSWVFSTEVGEMPMPIPNISDEDRQNLAAILISKNPINEEKDSEMTKLCKEQVQLAKKEMAKYIREGGDPDDFLQHYFQELKRAFEYRNEAIQQCEELAEEDPGMAAEFAKRINEKFSQEGIKTIPEAYGENAEPEE